ncbi:MAG TPA: transporter substrate-binding domain-containing protein [Oligoflexus sp.]|uniref:substrate-binding periplasmic protein n=1 Tax=Oligoflexus sp. TaxID=1971216 RepID=UPI002D7E388A|nr:transporter substrate-binding domain-containing protein [Oligoflexus sp.]HET9236679.1 transporter substrate-binding domain-containing protein [Oligoflexus sp.]
MKWLWITMLCILSASVRAGTLPSKITVGTDDMRPWVDRDAPEFGIIARIVSRAFGLVQIQLHFEWVPWKRLFHPIHGQAFDAVFPMGYNDERARIFLYSDELIKLDRVACHRKDQPFVWTAAEDFRGKKIAFRRGAHFGPLYTQLLERNLASFIEADSDLSMIKMLLAKRIDLFFCQPREIKQSMQTYVNAGLLEAGEMSQVVTKGKPILSAPLHVGFPRRTSGGQDSVLSIQLRDRFNKGLARLKAAEPQLFLFEQY